MIKLKALFAAALPLALVACQESPAPTELGPEVASLAKTSTSSLYRLRFVVETAEGEITSPAFPDAGVSLNTRDPWRNLSIKGAPLSLNNYTNGVWGQGGCVFNDVRVNWDIAGTDPVRSFAGSWTGEMSTWRSSGGMNFGFAGTRADGSPGAIQNVVSNNNAAIESKADDKSWFKIKFVNARMGFGSASTPDGNGTLADLAGYEAACANFTILATRI